MRAARQRCSSAARSPPAATGEDELHAPAGAPSAAAVGEAGGQSAQDEDEDGQRDRLDGELGQRQVGRAVQHVEESGAVAGDPGQDGRLHPLPGQDAQHRDPGDADRDDELRDRVVPAQRVRVGPGRARHQPRGLEAEQDDQGGAEVDGQRAALHGSGDLEGEPFQAPQGTGEHLVAVDQREPAAQCGQRPAGQEERRTQHPGDRREAQRGAPAVPEGEVVGGGAAGEGVGVPGQQRVEPLGAGAEQEPGQRAQQGRTQQQRRHAGAGRHGDGCQRRGAALAREGAPQEAQRVGGGECGSPGGRPPGPMPRRARPPAVPRRPLPCRRTRGAAAAPPSRARRAPRRRPVRAARGRPRRAW